MLTILRSQTAKRRHLEALIAAWNEERDDLVPLDKALAAIAARRQRYA